MSFSRFTCGFRSGKYGLRSEKGHMSTVTGVTYWSFWYKLNNFTIKDLKLETLWKSLSLRVQQ